MTTSRFVTNSSEAFFVTSNQDIATEVLNEDTGIETQIISGFAADEPMIIA